MKHLRQRLQLLAQECRFLRNRRVQTPTQLAQALPEARMARHQAREPAGVISGFVVRGSGARLGRSSGLCGCCPLGWRTVHEPVEQRTHARELTVCRVLAQPVAHQDRVVRMKDAGDRTVVDKDSSPCVGASVATVAGQAAEVLQEKAWHPRRAACLPREHAHGKDLAPRVYPPQDCLREIWCGGGEDPRALQDTCAPPLLDPIQKGIQARPHRYATVVRRDLGTCADVNHDPEVDLPKVAVAMHTLTTGANQRLIKVQNQLQRWSRGRQ
mmetsp:Transcript_96423/g.267899  ORF Transcript_96423/g.267899 Transcript_96423/m.267899 type:complete len:270 (-) Transcript_96423:135-944(-)